MKVTHPQWWRRKGRSYRREWFHLGLERIVIVQRGKAQLNARIGVARCTVWRGSVKEAEAHTLKALLVRWVEVRLGGTVPRL